jgi:hypothetical protein
MPNKIIYYAIVDETSSRAHPSGVLRRTDNDEGEIDEIFSRDLTWEFSPLLYAAENGDLTNEFAEITEAEAATIVERIKAEAADQK